MKVPTLSLLVDEESDGYEIRLVDHRRKQPIYAIARLDERVMAKGKPWHVMRIVVAEIESMLRTLDRRLSGAPPEVGEYVKRKGCRTAYQVIKVNRRKDLVTLKDAGTYPWSELRYG